VSAVGGARGEILCTEQLCASRSAGGGGDLAVGGGKVPGHRRATAGGKHRCMPQLGQLVYLHASVMGCAGMTVLAFDSLRIAPPVRESRHRMSGSRAHVTM